LFLIAESPTAFTTNAEVLQELLHRYRALGRWQQGKVVFGEFALLMEGRIEAVHSEDVSLAASWADHLDSIDSRDLVHAAVMSRLGITELVSSDRGFDRLPGFERLDPSEMEVWRSRVG
jgi:predicted nucleic acid-binding protein